MDNEIGSLVCVECGGKEFEINFGFYYCNQCQTQSQNVQDLYLDNFDVIGAQKYKKKKTGGKKENLSARAVELMVTEKCTIMGSVLREQIDWLEREGHVSRTKDTFRRMCREIWFRYLETQNIHESEISKWGNQTEPKYLPAILYLSGIYSGDSVCLFQLSRWLKSGSMPFFREFYSKRTLTPCTQITFGDLTPCAINNTVNQLMALLKVPVPKLIPHPVPIIGALLRHLHLPACLQKFVEKLLKIAYRTNSCYLSHISQDYSNSNETKMLCLIICLLRIVYCLDGEEENTIERCWVTHQEVRYLEDVDEKCDHTYLWNDWVKLHSLEVLLHNELNSTQTLPQLSNQTATLKKCDSLLRHQTANEMATLKTRKDPISLDLIEMFWNALDSHKKRCKPEVAECGTHGEIDATRESILRDIRDNFTPRAVKLNECFKTEFPILFYKIKNLSALDRDLVPVSFMFLLEVCCEVLGTGTKQLFQLVAEQMAVIIESTNSVLINNPV